jgi:uridine kinase
VAAARTLANVTRGALLDRLAQMIEAAQLPHPVRVAVDGPDAAGKTTLANELAAVLTERRRNVVRASIDGFHRPRAERYLRGEDSPEGYYEDSFDYAALEEKLLDPLGPGGDRVVRTAVFDHRADAPMLAPRTTVQADAILLVDGVFLPRPELVDHWDLRIFASVSAEEALRRAFDRDLALFGSREEVERRYRTRYSPGQKLYFAAARPLDRADVLVRNDDPAEPLIEIRRAS